MADVKKSVEDGWNAWFRGDVETVMQSYADDAELTLPGSPTLRGKDAIRANWQAFKGALPDEHPTSIRHVAEGNTVVTIWVTEATHSGPLPMPNGETLPPTGKKVVTRGVTVQEIEGDKVKRQAFYFDNLAFLQQLGVIPEPGAVAAG